MDITQTKYFKEDVIFFTQRALDTMYTTAREETRKALYQLERMRGAYYCDKLAAKCNQKAKCKFYYRDK